MLKALVGRSSWRPPRRLTLVLLVSILMITALPGAAGVVFYHSPNDDGLPPAGTPVLPGIPGETIYLYLDGGWVGSTLGTPCVDGEGDEVCAWEFVLGLAGPASLAAFTADAARDIVWSSTASQLRATGGNAMLGDLGPVRLGEIELTTSGQGWSASITSGSVVNAGFALDDVDEHLIAVPEPGLPLQVGCGILWLLLFGSRRRSAR